MGDQLSTLVPLAAGHTRPASGGVARPQSQGVQIADRHRTRADQRGARLSFFPGGGNDPQAVVIASIGSTAVGVGPGSFSMNPVPPGVQAAILVVTVNSTTATAGNVHVRFFASTAAQGVAGDGDSIAAVMANSVGALGIYSGQVIVPLVGGQVLYQVGISGTVQYAVNFYHAGWVT